MNVEVRLYGSLRRYRPPEVATSFPQPFVVDLAAGSSVTDLGLHLGIPDDVPSVAAVNDVAVGGDMELQGGDRVSLFPAAGC